MAHIVCVTHGRSGLLYSSFELVRRLEAAGHQVTYLTQSSAIEAAKAQGLQCEALPTVPTQRPHHKPSKTQGVWEGLRTLWTRQQQAIGALGMEAFANRLRALSPDALLIDIELHACIITAVPLGIPTALLSPFFTVWKRSGVPPLHKPIIPGVGWRGSRLGIEWAWLRFRMGKLLARIRTLCQFAGVDDVAVLRHLARQTGFPFRRETARYQWLLPFTYWTLPVLCLNAFEMDFPHEPHPELHYVGPMIHRQRTDTRADSEGIAALRAARDAASAERPLILVLCSTFAATRSGFIDRVLDAAELRPGWDMVLSLGGRSSDVDRDALPNNVYLFPWVPVLDLLPETDVVVTNAGINTINECIRFGVPSVVYSLGSNDQNGTAARVAYHDVGVVGDLKGESAQRFVNQIEEARSSEQIRSNIDTMRDRFRAYEAEARAVEIVERLIPSR